MAKMDIISIAFALLLCFCSTEAQRWSRQVQSTGFTATGPNDWVPVQFSGPKTTAGTERQSAARVLNFAPPNLQQLQQQQPSSQPQQLSQYVPQQIFQQPQQQPISFSPAGEPFQLVSPGQQRFQVQQAPVQFQHQPQSGQASHLFQQPQHQQPPPAPHLPRFHYTQQQPSPSAFPPHQQQQQIQIQQHITQVPQHQEKFPQSRPQQHHAHHRIPQQLSPAEINQHYQYPTFIEQEPQPQPQQLQHVLQQQYEVHQAPAFLQHNPPSNIRPHVEPLIQKTPKLYGQEPEPIIRHHSENPQLNQIQESEEEVQLLYVPLETLHQQNQPQLIHNPNKQQPINQNNKYNVHQAVNPLQINHFYTPTPTVAKSSSTTSAPYLTSPAYSFTPTPRFAQTPITTPKPKVKSHQPPLAMFMLNDVGHSQISVNDVLGALKNAKNIEVLDSASKKSPKVFVGPSGLRTPDGYSKFELPYLSSIEQNRAERQVTKLPFFVAPLSYKAPDGFAKIPLPAPHVGSVVINRPPEVIEYQSVNLQVPQPQPQRQYPKKVHSSTSNQAIEQSTVFRSPPKYNLGFKLGSDVFTTTSKPASYYTPSSTRAPSTIQDPQYSLVSTTPSYKHSEPTYSRNPSTESNYRQLVSSTQSPKGQSPGFEAFYKPFVSTTHKPSQQYEQINRRPQAIQSPAFISTTPATLNHEENNRFPDHQSFRGSRPVSSTQAPLSTYSSQQHEEEYSNFGQFSQFNAPSRFPSAIPSSTPAPKQNSYDDSFSGFSNPKSKPTANVQTEEYFNIQKSPQIESFAIENKTQDSSFVPNHFNQFHPSKDYFNIPQITSSDSSASAPKPTQSENFSFEPIKSKVTTPRPEITYTSKPVEYSTRAQEILQMKNYFRDQNSQKSRPVSSENSAVFPASSPSSNQHFDLRASTTETAVPESSIVENHSNPLPPRNSITYYTPRPFDDEDETEKSVHHFKYVDSVVGKDFHYNNEQKETTRPTESYTQSEYSFPVKSSTERPHTEKPVFYSNHRETYQEPSTSIEYLNSHKDTRPTLYENTSPTLSPYDAYTKSLETKSNYRPKVEINNEEDSEQSFNLPSELPPISANLPGLVNSLYVEQTESEPYTTTATPPTTRRNVNRGRRPQSQVTRATVTRAPVTRAPRTTTVTASPTESEDYTTRRAPVRGRRPIHYANRTTTVRTPTARNPNRIRYNPTSEERQRIRTKQTLKGKDEDLEYQRDVLNQNYPVITKPTSTEYPSTTESDRPTKYTTAVSYAHETERYSSHYRADPNQDTTFDSQPNHSASSHDYATSTARSTYDIPDHFSEIEDHMQIPQEHQTLHGDFYNSESDVSAAEAINGHRPNDGHPVFLANTMPTTTADEVTGPENVVELQRTRRPNFVKRPVAGRSYSSSTSAPTSAVTQSYDRPSRERFTIRPKTKQDAATVGYTPKPRGNRLRTRPTTPATPATTSREPELQTYVDESYQQISRFNKDFYQDAPPRIKNHPQKQQAKSVRVSPPNEQKRFKYERFALDAQESQWSTKLSQNSFIPVDPESNKSSKSLKNSYELTGNAEPEIVTAGSLLNGESNPESYLLKVSSSFAGNSEEKIKPNVTTEKPPVSEASFVDLLEEAMSDIGNEVLKKQPEMQDRNEVFSVTTNTPFTSEASTEESTSTHSPQTNGGRRRGVWKRVRVRPVDTFETAESQNYGSRVFNSLLTSDSKQYKESEKVFAPLHRFSLEAGDDEIDESETPRKEDLSTPVPLEELFPTSNQLPTEQIKVSSTNNASSKESFTTTTEQPEVTTIKNTLENNKEETSKDEDRFSFGQVPLSSTMTSTRRYDLSDASDDLLMESDEDHTQFPFSFDGVNDEVETKTEFAVTDRPFYDDYDTELKVDPTVIPIDASHSGSMMSEVKQKLSELFSFTDDYDYENAIKPQPHKYTTIERTKPAATIPEPEIEEETVEVEESVTSTPASILTEAPTTTAPITTTTMAPSKAFHKKLMESVIYATSTSTEISHETEICYRGRCIKSEKKP